MRALLGSARWGCSRFLKTNFCTQSFSEVLQSCNNIEEAKRIHEQLASSGLDSRTDIGNLIIAMYDRCGSAECARDAFDRLHERGLISWTLLLSAFLQNGYSMEALWSFKLMQLEGVKPSNITLVKVLCACAESRNLAEGMKIHEQILQSTCDVYLSAALINFYSKCRWLERSEAVFEAIYLRDEVCWNSMMRAYVAWGEFDKCLKLYLEFLHEGMRPKLNTFINALSACAGLEAHSQGKSLHSQIIESGFACSTGLAGRLIHFYGKCRDSDLAKRVFSLFSSSDSVLWNSMLAAYTQLGKNKEALELYHLLNLEGVKSCVITFISVADACGALGDRLQGKQIHSRAAEAGVERDEVLVGCLINMYGKCGELEEARKILDSTTLSNVVSCTGMITAYLQQGQLKSALQLLHLVEQAGTRVNQVTLMSILAGFSNRDHLPAGRAFHERLVQSGQCSSVNITNTLISMYGKCGSLPEARDVFENSPAKSSVSWNNMIGACVHQGDGKQAVEIFRKMDLEGVPVSNVTLANVLEGCIQLGDLITGRSIHSGIRGSTLEHDDNVKTVLLNMYTKCGSRNLKLEDINFISDSVVAWTSMIGAHARSGRFGECLKHSRRMEVEGIKFNQVTFLTVLFACSHAGFVEQGCDYFVRMIREHRFEPNLEHCSCMVDLLARSGWLREAEEFISRMHIAANRATWLSLLNACKMHQDVERALQAAKKILELDPGNFAACSLLDGVCSST